MSCVVFFLNFYSLSFFLLLAVSLNNFDFDLHLLLGFCVFPCLHVPWTMKSEPCSGLSVSWLMEGSQSFQHKHETLWLWTAENKPPYQCWTSLGSQSCLWTTLAANTDMRHWFHLLAADAKPAAPFNTGQIIRKITEALWLVKKPNVGRVDLFWHCLP